MGNVQGAGERRLCEVAGCDNTAKCRGWCLHHYDLWRKYGDPEAEPRRAARSTDGCSVEDCDRPHGSKGFCAMHYVRWKRYGDPLVHSRMPRPCSIEGCDRRAEGRGWCALHYRRWKRHGDPEFVAHRSRPGVCSVDGCGQAPASLGLCRRHYKAQWRHGNPLHRERHPQPAECVVPTCTKPADSRGFCFAHYRRWRLFGDPLVTNERFSAPVIDGKRRCLWCERDMPVSSFAPSKRGRYRLQPYCKACASHIAWLSRIKGKYGLTQDRYEEMLVAQNHACAICKTKPDQRLSVDHDHTTGAVRGLLCAHCNHILGLMEDDPQKLRAAADYLEAQLAR